MRLGWEHCGYDSIERDEPLDMENSMAWYSPQSSRGEKAHLLSPVGLPSDVIDRDSRQRLRPRQQQQQQQQQQHQQHQHQNQHHMQHNTLHHSPYARHGSVNSAEGVEGGAPSAGIFGGFGGGSGGGISSFFGGVRKGFNNNSSNDDNSSSSNNNNNNHNNLKRAGLLARQRTRFLSEDSSASVSANRRRCQNPHAFDLRASPGDRKGAGGGAWMKPLSPASLWHSWQRGAGRTGSADDGLARQYSENARGSVTSHGHNGGDSGGGGGSGGGGSGEGMTPAKIPEMVPAAFFDPDYDTSRHHLVKLFNALDDNQSGTITYEAMRMGLANLGTYSDVNYLMRRAELDKTEEITLDGFVEIVQDYAEKMFAAKQAVPVSCFCYDYSPEKVAFRWVKTGQANPPSPSVSLRELMSEGDDKKAHVRWVCVTGSDPSLVIHLANRFGIHPLQVEDCLNPRERLKVDAFRAAPVKPPRKRTSNYGIPASTAATTAGNKEATAVAQERNDAAAKPPNAAGSTAAGESPKATGAGPAAVVAAEGAAAAAAATAATEAAAAASPATLPPPRGAPPRLETVAAAAGAAAAAAAGAAAEAGEGEIASPPADTGAQDESRVGGAGPAISGATGNDSGTSGGAAGGGGCPSQETSVPAPAPSTPPGDNFFPDVAVASSPPAPAEEILHVLLGRISLRNPTMGRPSNFEREQVSIFLVGNHTVLFIEPTASGVSDQISNRVYYAGSKVRLNNARYLVYSLMDSIVDDVFPIMQQFQAWLVQLQDRLHSEDSGPSLEVVRAIQQISRDMHMITFYLRPMKVVATQLITDLPGNDLDLKRHLEDLRDHLLMLEEQALRMSTWSRSLNKDWVNEQQHRMNQVVYILTMVTSAFMPAQFLTGVFGMNFKFMPELNWRYSYASFWVLVALLAFSSYTVYKRHKWL